MASNMDPFSDLEMHSLVYFGSSPWLPRFALLVTGEVFCDVSGEASSESSPWLPRFALLVTGEVFCDVSGEAAGAESKASSEQPSRFVRHVMLRFGHGVPGLAVFKWGSAC